MAPDAVSDWRLLLPPSLRALPGDLVAVLLLVVLVFLAVFVPRVDETPLRVVVGVPFLLFVPGYALLSVLFPSRRPDGSPRPASPDEETDGRDGARGEGAENGIEAENGSAIAGDGERHHGGRRTGGLSTLERVAVASGSSVAIVALVGIVLDGTAWGVTLESTLVAVGGVSVVLALLGARRRLAVPPSLRPTVPMVRALRAARARLFRPASGLDRVLTVVAVVSVLAAGVSVGIAASPGAQADNFTEFYLLVPAPDGTLVADDYPTAFDAGTPQRLVVGVDNHERTRLTYTVVTTIDRVDESSRVVETRELDRFTVTLAHGEVAQEARTVAPEMTGERLRLTYYLYRGAVTPGEAPGEAYRTVHLWVDVTGEEGR